MVVRTAVGKRTDVCWIGLNPGTGDTERRPRPTLRKVTAWADEWGMKRLLVVNLFAFRAADARALRGAKRLGHDIVGDPKNLQGILTAAAQSKMILAGWGRYGTLQDRGRRVASLVSGMVCLGTTAESEPLHPLYVAQSTVPVAFTPEKNRGSG